MSRSREMTPQEEKYMYHLLKSDPLIGSYIRSQLGNQNALLDLPVCPRCEKPSLYHQNGAICPTCGTFALKEKTHKVREHIKQGHYR